MIHKDTRVLMGTFVEVTSSDPRAPGLVFGEIARLENILSKYKPGSEISRLNASGREKVCGDTFSVIKKAREFWELSDGAFDITVGPLISLWGFSDKNYSIPSDAQIKKALQLVGSDKIVLREDESMVILKYPGMKIDLGGIAKGYALDSAVARLRDNGIRDCLINLGGQVYCLGQRPGSRGKGPLPWKVALRHPRGKGLLRRFTLQDKSLATSGDYQQYFIRAGARYSHIIDPRLGYPARTDLVSVTVEADQAVTADALSTAIFVLGQDKGLKLSRKYSDVRVEFVRRNDL